MAYVWLTDLDQALTAAGIPFLEVPFSSADPTGASSWRTRGRPYSTGSFEPSGVLCHHTASPEGCDAATDLRVVLAGNGSAPGPVSQLYLGRDAVCYLVAAGRCNHGGGGIRPGIDNDCEDLNSALLGIEVGNNGVGEYWGDAQTDLYGAVVAALCQWYGWATPSGVYLHGQTGPPSGGCNSKIDPAGPWVMQPDLVGSTMWNVDVWRAWVDDRRALRPPEPEPEPEPTPPEEEEMPAYLVSHPDGRWFVTDMASYKTYVTDPSLGPEGAILWNWKTVDGAGAPYGLGPGWGPFLDQLPDG
jgi:hypothetical protein